MKSFVKYTIQKKKNNRGGEKERKKERKGVVFLESDLPFGGDPNDLYL